MAEDSYQFFGQAYRRTIDCLITKEALAVLSGSKPSRLDAREMTRIYDRHTLIIHRMVSARVRDGDVGTSLTLTKHDVDRYNRRA